MKVSTHRVWSRDTAVLFTLLFGLTLLPRQSFSQNQAYTAWNDYGGSADSMQYSALSQINKSNVDQLELAWFSPAPGPGGRFAFNPLVVDGTMYVVGEDSAIFALDAATGKQIWVHPVEGSPTNRGFNYWESDDRKDRRIIFAANSYLQQINALTGITIPSFGDDGRVDLREGLGRDPATMGNVQSGTPGRVFENLIILGSAPGEGYFSPPGDLRAYDVLTGELIWTFHTIPRPGEFGYETWPPDVWKYAGGVNTWGEISIDEERSIAYFPLGSPTFDLYGGDRKGQNLFGNCLLALDARTGKRLWHFQTVHHDLWDYDLTTAPKLLTVRHNGEMVDVVAQATKFGLLYVFDRVSGEPLWPIEERPVPKSDVPGEESWPTQPFPTKPPPYARLQFTVEDLNPYVDPEEKERWRKVLEGAYNEGIFTPTSYERDTVTVPGELGGTNFGGVGADPETGMLYVRTADQPAMHILREWSPGSSRRAIEGTSPAQRGRTVFSQHCQLCHGLPEGGGIRSMDGSLVISLAAIGADRFRNAVRTGRGQMPAFSEDAISEDNVGELISYITNPAAGEETARDIQPQTTEAGESSAIAPMPAGETRYTGRLGAMMFTDRGLTAMSPPWAELVAYDLNEGDIKWRKPLGTVPALAAIGIKNTGNNYRLHRTGLAVTAGGLVLIGTWSDRYVRAFDKDTGEILWERELEANPAGIPAIYEVEGRQYVAFFASSADTPPPHSIAFVAGKPEAQGYYVFSLPE